MRGHKPDLVLLETAEKPRPQWGPSPLLGVVKELMFLRYCREQEMKLFRGELLP